MQFTIDTARSADLKRLTEIYNYYIIHSHATFDTEEFSIKKRETWFQNFSEEGAYRLFVARQEENVLAYASSTAFRPKPAYYQSVETTIYIDPLYLGRGIGLRLYHTLIRTLEQETSVHRAFAGIALPNEASANLHQRFGFKLIGVFTEVGFKFGRYWDVAWYDRDLSQQTLGPLQ
jgi:phosphinothricin acetyltransferase